MDLSEARAVGEKFSKSPLEPFRIATQRRVRESLGLTEEPPAACMDDEQSFFPTDSIVRELHADLASMLIGGLASLMFQSLHPLAMAGVAQHSRYKDDPLGRLARTARFVGITSFGSTDDAERAMSAVTNLHRRVTGTTPDGETYRATDPELLSWVHNVEVWSFLAAAKKYGAISLTDERCNQYLSEMTRVASGLGALSVPQTEDSLSGYFEDIRPQLHFGDSAREARNFVLRGVARWPHERMSYAILVSAAIGLLPSWARRELRLPSVPAADAVFIRPLATGFCHTLRIAIGPPPTTPTT